MAELTIYTDGGARGNPGPAATGVVIYTTDNQELLRFGHYLGSTTNNVAEYTAAVQALEAAKQFNPKTIEVRMDSQLAVRQLEGLYRVKSPALKELYDQVKEHCESFDKVTFTHVPRGDNKEADREVNKALDEALS